MKLFLFLLTALCIVSCDMPKSENTDNSDFDPTNVGKSVALNKNRVAQDALDVTENTIPAEASETPGETDGIKRGTFLYYADAATFTECETGKKYAVVGNAYLAMEKAYLKNRTKDFQQIYTEVVGDYKMQAGMEPGTKEMTLMAEEIVLMDAAKSCE